MLLRPLRRFNLPPTLLSTASRLLTTNNQLNPTHESPQFTTLTPAEFQPKSRSRLAGKNYLPGSAGDGFPELLSPPTETFPHAAKMENPSQYSIGECVNSCKGYLQQNLTRYGAVLLRNLPVETAAGFSIFCRELGYKGMEYSGGAVDRKAVDKSSGTYTSSDEPPEVVIELHNEMAYSPVYPRKLLFFCEQEPGDDCGGETPLVKSNDILARLDPKVVQTLTKKGIRYVRYTPPRGLGAYLPWQDVFMTEDPKATEEFLKEKGYSFKWDSSGALIYWQVLPAFVSHPKTGEMTWFNQIQSHHASHLQGKPRFKDSGLPTHQYATQTYYGDGTAIEPAILQHIRNVTWSCTVGFRWKKGDLLAVDNVAAQHGRMNFSGQRRILTLLSQD